MWSSHCNLIDIEHIKCDKIYSEIQFGCRKGRETIVAFLFTKIVIQSQLEVKKSKLLIDLKLVFDTVLAARNCENHLIRTKVEL